MLRSDMREEQNAYRFFTVLVVLAVLLFAIVMEPFVEALFLAAVLAGGLYPVQQRISALLRGRPKLSAFLLTAGTLLIVLAPTSVITTVLVKETVEGARFVVSTVQDSGVRGLIEKLPDPANRYLNAALAHAPIAPEELDKALRDKARTQQDKAGALVQGALSTTGAVVLQTALFAIALFFLLVDGELLVAWCEDASPLPEGQTLELLTEFRRVSVSVIVSSVATGAIQTVAALIGYWIAGVPNPWFFAIVTFFMSFVPAIGAGGTSFVAALLLLAKGKLGMAIFLGIWGTFAVGLSDNLVKPLLAKRGTRLHGAVLFFALVGGIAAFGTIGLLLGPLIVSFLPTLVRIRKGHQKPLVEAAT